MEKGLGLGEKPEAFRKAVRRSRCQRIGPTVAESLEGEARATRFRIPRGTYYLPLQQEFFRFHKTQS